MLLLHKLNSLNKLILNTMNHPLLSVMDTANKRKSGMLAFLITQAFA